MGKKVISDFASLDKPLRPGYNSGRKTVLMGSRNGWTYGFVFLTTFDVIVTNIFESSEIKTKTLYQTCNTNS